MLLHDLMVCLSQTTLKDRRSGLGLFNRYLTEEEEKNIACYLQEVQLRWAMEIATRKQVQATVEAVAKEKGLMDGSVV